MNKEKIYLSDEKAQELYQKLQDSVNANVSEAVNELKTVILSEVYQVLKAWTSQESAPELIKPDIKQVDIIEKPV